MLKSKITLRLAASFLLVVLVSLALLGAYLLNYFHDRTMEKERDSLILNAQIIEMTLADKLYTHDDVLAAISQQISRETDLRITILDENGTVLADTSEPADTLDNHLQREEVQEAMNHEYGTATRYSQTLKENRMYAAVPVYNNGRLIGIIRTSASLAASEQAYADIVRSICFALMMALLAALVISLWLARRQVRPIQQMSQAALAIAGGDLQRRLHWHSGDEFDILAHTINKLTANLSQKIQEAQAETHKLSLILENMDNGVMLIDNHGDIIGLNRQAQEFFQLQPEQLKRHSIHVIGSALLSETAQQVLRDNQAQTITFHTGQPVDDHTFQVFLSPFPSGSEQAVLAVFHDISLLQEISSRQTEFVGNAAHELATPLTAISGFAETLLDDDFSAPDLSRQCIRSIYDEACRLSRLVNDLLQLARLERRDYRSQLRLETIDASQLPAKIGQRLAPQLTAKKLQFSVSTTPQPIFIEADPELAAQILTNLVENAIQYTPEGGRITLACEASDSEISFLIRDNGSGIAPEDLPFIFDRFYRADKARTRTSGGSGIGLSLVRFLVELFDGRISVTSELRQGTAFTVTLPRQEAPKEK